MERRINLRVSEYEYQQWAARAAQGRRTLSDYIRWAMHWALAVTRDAPVEAKEAKNGKRKQRKKQQRSRRRG